MARAGLRKVFRCSREFKREAVRLGIVSTSGVWHLLTTS